LRLFFSLLFSIAFCDHTYRRNINDVNTHLAGPPKPPKAPKATKPPKGNNPPCICDDGIPCTDDTCDALGACIHTVKNCDDGLYCNGIETCNPSTGVCLSGTPVDCDDSDPCTIDACDNTVSSCTAELKCDDHNVCNGLEGCDSDTGACLPGHIDEDVYVKSVEVCDPVTGECVSHWELDCEGGDFDVCDGVDYCDHILGCVPDNSGVNCDDGYLCSNDYCDPSTGVCDYSPIGCDDGDLCTNDFCDPSTGVCDNSPISCDDGYLCTNDFCDPSTGVCDNSPISCDDSNPCTNDFCDTSCGCFYTDNSQIDCGA